MLDSYLLNAVGVPPLTTTRGYGKTGADLTTMAIARCSRSTDFSIETPAPGNGCTAPGLKPVSASRQRGFSTAASLFPSTGIVRVQARVLSSNVDKMVSDDVLRRSGNGVNSAGCKLYDIYCESRAGPRGHRHEAFQEICKNCRTCRGVTRYCWLPLARGRQPGTLLAS